MESEMNTYQNGAISYSQNTLNIDEESHLLSHNKPIPKKSGGANSYFIFVGLTFIAALGFLLFRNGTSTEDARTNLEEVAAENDNLSLHPYVFYHFEYLCNGCAGIVTTDQKKSFKRTFVVRESVRNQIQVLAQADLKSKVGWGEGDSKDKGSDGFKASVELDLMSRLENTFAHEYVTTITTAEEMSEEIRQTINFDHGYGFIQQCVKVKFLDEEFQCVPLHSDLEHLYNTEGNGMNKGFVNYIQVILEDPDNYIDATIFTLAQHCDFYAKYDAAQKQAVKERVGRFDEFFLNHTYHNVEKFPIYEFHKSVANPPNVPGTAYQDYYYSRDPSATQPGYSSDGPKFSAPISVENPDEWEEVYLQWDQDNVHKNHRLSFGDGNLGFVFFVAKTPDVVKGLVPLCDSYDAKHFSHVYYINEAGCGGSTLGYVFKL